MSGNEISLLWWVRRAKERKGLCIFYSGHYNYQIYRERKKFLQANALFFLSAFSIRFTVDQKSTRLLLYNEIIIR